jgi:hypothetical protein
MMAYQTPWQHSESESDSDPEDDDAEGLKTDEKQRRNQENQNKMRRGTKVEESFSTNRPNRWGMYRRR